MNYAIDLLQASRKKIERNIKNTALMQKDRTQASRELAKINELKRAVKILKNKNRN